MAQILLKNAAQRSKWEKEKFYQGKKSNRDQWNVFQGEMANAIPAKR
jgi:hypothetical protein